MNVTTAQVLDIVDIKIQQKKKNLQKMLDIIRPGKSYRPHQFKDLPVCEQTVWIYLKELEDDGKIQRHVIDGLVVFIQP
jgi:hypothetical protein